MPFHKVTTDFLPGSQLETLPKDRYHNQQDWSWKEGFTGVIRGIPRYLSGRAPINSATSAHYWSSHGGVTRVCPSVTSAVSAVKTLTAWWTAVSIGSASWKRSHRAKQIILWSSCRFTPSEGNFMLVCDWRKLNKTTVKKQACLPNIDDIFDTVQGSKHFTKLDLRSGYNQVRVRDEDVARIAINTPVGHYEFKVAPAQCAAQRTVMSKWRRRLP